MLLGTLPHSGRIRGVLAESMDQAHLIDAMDQVMRIPFKVSTTTSNFMIGVTAAASAGVEPNYMGIGPVPATRKALAKAGLSLAQMDVVELNEAFASQALAVLRELGIPEGATHVNPNGGAIAIGHPLGASGARLVTTALYQLLRTKGRYALCTMCIGVGQGIAVILERV